MSTGFRRVKVWEVSVVEESRMFLSKQDMFKYLQYLIEKPRTGMKITIEIRWVSPEHLMYKL